MQGLINWIKRNLILSIAYVCVGIGLFVLGKFLYHIDETYNIGGNLTPEEMAQTGQVGDFIGGVIGAYSGGYPFSISGDIRSVPS